MLARARFRYTQRYPPVAARRDVALCYHQCNNLLEYANSWTWTAGLLELLYS